MLVVTMFNLKPGTAKSTCAIFLAAALHTLGLCVLLVDADRAMATLGWAGMTGKKFPIRTVGLAVPNIHHQIVTVTEGSPINAVVIDCPQMEDHADIVRGALSYTQAQGATGHAVMTIGAKNTELYRVGPVRGLLTSNMGYESKPWALLNRTSRMVRSKDGKDARAARALTKQGFRVFDNQVQYNDGVYDSSMGHWPLPLDRTPFLGIAEELMNA